MLCHKCSKIYNDCLGFCPYCGEKKISYEENDELATADDYAKSEIFNRKALEVSHDYNQRLGYLNESLKFNPKNESTWINKAEAYKNGGYAGKAVDCLNKALSINHLNKKVWLEKGILLKKVGGFEEYFADLLRKCSENLKKNPNDDLYWQLKGKIHYELENYDKSNECYAEALKLNPNNKKLWEDKGRLCRYKLDDYEESKKCYLKAHELDDSDIKILEDLISTYSYYLKDYENALKYCNKGLEIDCNNRRLWKTKVELLNEMEEYEEALKCYNHILQLKPAWRDFTDNGELFVKFKQYEKAIECYDMVINENSENMYAWGLKRDALFELGEYEKSLYCNEKLIEMSSNYEPAILVKGVILRKINEKEGIDYFNDLVEKIDNSISTYPTSEKFIEKGKILYYMDKKYESLNCFDEALEYEFYDKEEILSWKGKIFYETNQFADALDCINQKLEKRQDFETLEFKGDILKELGCFEEAVECYDIILKLHPYRKSVICKKSELEN